MGDEERLLFEKHSPRPTEKCFDTSKMCWLKTLFGECSKETSACTRSCTSCTPYDEGSFYPKVVPMDEVEKHMSYAKTGSSIPESFHGIWWMDQSGASLPLEGDPDYPFDFNMTAEVLIAYGDKETEYQEDTKCISPVPSYSGTDGHFLLLNNVYGLKQWESFAKSRFTFHFCFTDDAQEEVLLWTSVKDTSGVVPDVRRKMLGYHHWGNGYFLSPQWLVNMKMVKKPWGWDRVTTVLTNNARDLLTPDNIDAVSSLMSQDMKDMVTVQAKQASDTISREYHYPVLQIVDGNGERTEHYKKYLNFMRNMYKMVPASPPGTAVIGMRI